ncbi:MAG TPA: ROK family protein [Candidatus Angelobacter sp.]|jgi:glucokinase|nr:ROK family protein [Candidatus Angelobacter sp.]
MATFAIGVDLGGTNLRIAAVDQQGKVLEKITTGTEVTRGRDNVIHEMCTAIQDLATKFRDSGSLAGIGIGVPGIIEMQSGMLRDSPNLPGWQDYPVKDEIERRLGATVILENDANAAALGEQWLGAASHVDDMCMITLGTGVGGGIVLHGRVWHGMTGMANELGHITVEPDGVPCGCGGSGCLEQYASATAVKRMAIEAVANGKAPELGRAMNEDPEFSAKVVYQMSVQGDEPAQKIFHVVGRAIGIVVADLVNIFNLPMYVIGGGVASAWEAFAPTLLEEVRKRSFVYRATAPSDSTRGVSGTNVHDDSLPARRNTIITRALLGSDAGLIGAARLPMVASEIKLLEQELKRA